MKPLRAWPVLAVMGLLLMLPLLAVAQDDNVPRIGLMQTARGTVDNDTPESRWQFEAQAGESVSVLVRSAGQLDPYLQVINEAGRVIAENDDIAYPDRLDAAVENLILEEAGLYTIRVTRFGFETGSSSGDFAVSLLPSHANLVYQDDFSTGDDWTSAGSDLVTVENPDGHLQLTVNASNALVWAEPSQPLDIPADAYIQVEAARLNDPDYWEYGIIFRKSSPTDYYLFAVSSRGDWAFLGRDGPSTWLNVQDWTQHPALSEPPTSAVLGVAMDGDEFTFYFNGEVLGTFSDSTHTEGGSIALSSGTVDQQATLPTVRYDNLLVTAPLPESFEAQVTGDGLGVESIEDAETVVTALVVQDIVPSGGSRVMLVPEGFTTTSRPGVNFIPLGQGRSETNLVIGATIVPETESPDNGCGLVFRREGEARYSLFFLDGLGGYGLAEWHEDRFDPSSYDRSEALTDLESYDVVLVAQSDQVIVYVNGEQLLARNNPPVSGGIGMTALSFDGSYVNCRFLNTWLWAGQ